MGIALWVFGGVGRSHGAASSCREVTAASPSDIRGSGQGHDHGTGRAVGSRSISQLILFREGRLRKS